MPNALVLPIPARTANPGDFVSLPVAVKNTGTPGYLAVSGSMRGIWWFEFHPYEPLWAESGETVEWTLVFEMPTNNVTGTVTGGALQSDDSWLEGNTVGVNVRLPGAPRILDWGLILGGAVALLLVSKIRR